MSNAVRTTRFGDFVSTQNPLSGGDKMSQATSLGQTYSSNNAWQGGIWSKNPIGSNFSNGKRDTSHSRDTDDDDFQGTKGSGALAATSEADPWGARINGWNNTSPPQSGSTSPVRHRGSNSSSGPNNILSDSQKTSPYLTTSRPAIGQGPGMNGRSVKSNLDPLVGPFEIKYPYSNQLFSLGDNKENVHHGSISGLDNSAFAIDQRGFRTGATSNSRDSSLPPSSHSNSSNSLFPGAGYSGFGHTPSNSVQLQRPQINGRTPSFPSTSRSHADGILDLEAKYRSNHLVQNVYQDSSNSLFDKQIPSPSPYSTYESRNQQPNGASAMWNSEKGYGHYATETSVNGVYPSSQNSGKQSRASDRDSVSPGMDYGRQASNPRYFNTGNTTVDPDSSYPRGQRAQNGVAELERGLQRLQFAPSNGYFTQQGIYSGQFQNQYPPHLIDYPQQFRNAPYYPSLPVPSYSANIPPPRGPARVQDVGHGIRSMLLEEFRSNAKSSKNYELKDIYGHVVEFSGDQHGSRFIQKSLETANSDEKDQVFREIQPNALQLMTDVFGNYVIQKLFEHGNQVQKRMIADSLKNHVHELSQQMYGCRVVQKALEFVLADQQIELVKELEVDVLTCVKDQNGNHVVQKAIERVPIEHLQFMVEAVRGNVHTLSIHPYGCRVVQRLLEFGTEQNQTSILEELFACAPLLIIDQYGNYVTQHVICKGSPQDSARLINIVTAQLLTFSKHKYASNVVEKCITNSSDKDRQAIVAQITALQSDGSSQLQLMMKDQYGNYVIQKLFMHLKGAERESLLEDIKIQLVALKKYNYGKQIAAIEKLIYPSPESVIPGVLGTHAPIGPKTLPLDIRSSVPTPMLTMEQNSPQSSSLPSTNASTVDGPTHDNMSVADKLMPKVRIESI